MTGPPDLSVVGKDGRDDCLVYLETMLRRYRRGGSQKQDAVHVLRAATYLFTEHGSAAEAGATFAQAIASVAERRADEPPPGGRAA